MGDPPHEEIPRMNPSEGSSQAQEKGDRANDPKRAWEDTRRRRNAGLRGPKERHYRLRKRK